MELTQAIFSRKSIRGFLPDPVPREVIEAILEKAVRAPSANNTQPWEFMVLGGETLKAVAKENVEWLRAGKFPEPDHGLLGWPNDSVFRTRQVALAKDLFRLMEIAREDKPARDAWMERGFRYFDAPAAIFIITDRKLTDSGPLMDVGAVMQNICLLALEEGLGTCIEDQGVMYPQVLRKLAGFPEDKRIIISIAIGRPDPDFPANQVETPREPPKNITTWLGLG